MLSVGDDKDPPLVMLHGGPGAGFGYLRPQMDALAEAGRRRLVYYDQREGASAQELVEELEEIRESLGRERMDVLGYSWGGLLGMLYALAHPERLGKLALVSPAPARQAERQRMQENMARAAQRPEVLAWKQTLDLTDKRARFALAVSSYFYDPKRALELTPFLVKQRSEQAVWSSLGDYDLLGALSAITVDALVVHGREDPIPVESARQTARVLHADFVELSPCGHSPYIEAPAALFSALRRFLAQDGTEY